VTEESLIEFPCHLPIKVMGRNTPEFRDTMVTAATSEAGTIAEDAVSIRLSRDGRFASLTLTVYVENHDHLRRVYTAMHATGLVLYAL
jgi:putative lipoic acid-binding regulatory protein